MKLKFVNSEAEYLLVNHLIVAVVLISLGLISAPINAAQDKTQLSIAMYAQGGEHREHVRNLIENFNQQHPNIHVKLLAYNGVERYEKTFKDKVNKGVGPDIMWWFGGSRVKKYAEEDKLHDLTSFWQSRVDMTTFSPSVMNAVMVDDKIYGIPVTYNLIALYYGKSVFDDVGIQVPKSWSDLLNACHAFKQQNKNLFALGTRTTEWILHGWFDYLNLRLNGLEFHQSLLAGELSFMDNRVKIAMQHFKQLVENQCFNSDHGNFTTWDVFPTITRGIAGMTLSANLPSQIKYKSIKDIGLVEFPMINPNIPNYTVTPVDTFVVPKYTELTDELLTVLTYLTSEQFQIGFVGAINVMPPRDVAFYDTNSLNQQVADIVKKSPGGIQYFDRDADIDFSRETQHVFLRFMQHLDVDKALGELEHLRLNHY